MADPFSIIAGTAGVVDVCSRVVKNLYHLQQGLGHIDEDITALAQEVEGLKGVCQTVRETFDLKSDDGSSPELAKISQETNNIWKQLERALRNCHDVVTKLDTIIKKISGSPDGLLAGKLDNLRKTLRKRLRESDIHACRVQLVTYQNALQLVLTVITFEGLSVSGHAHARSFKELLTELQNIDRNLESRISDLQATAAPDDSKHDIGALAIFKELRESVTSAVAAIKEVSSNHYFDAPQSVSSIFTGRETQLQELRAILVPRSVLMKHQRQRRFIVQGLGGSGKTQFCCKFAEENRDYFWGIFWIDASTPDRVKQTLGSISNIAGVEKTQNAVFHWLSNLDRTWLLIIDNADDLDIPLDRYFPKGNRGSILVTTRNPAYKFHGNVGPGFYEFRGLQLDEATRLLLRASGEPTPWDSACESLALSISEALGFLALALIHAGAAIRDKLCSLKDYLDYYGRSWQRLRSSRAASKATAEEAIFYATWEICHSRLEGRQTESAYDALQLLNTLAFFYREDISQDIFIRAVRNAELEAEEEKMRATTTEGDDSTHSSSRSCAELVRRTPAALMMFAFDSRSPTPLPGIIRDGRRLGGADDAEDRIRFALKELTQMSLVIRNDYNNTYSMHPIIHTWARERPSMTRSDQSLWADVAGMVLSASILLPPLGTTEKDDTYHLGLLPHIRHVQACRKVYSGRLLKQADASQAPLASWLASLVPMAPDRDRTRMYAKFSLVYAKCGALEEAKSLLVTVRDFLYKHMGPEHERSRQATLFLSKVHWNLGQPIKAAELQQDVLDLCRRHLGASHPDTLRAMAELGKTRWQQGQITEARELQEKVLSEMVKIFPPDHKDTLDAMDSLGLTIHKFWEDHHFDRAHQLCSDAVAGMNKVHGPHHERTLLAKENLCRVAALRGGPGVGEAADLMGTVLETRRRKLGKEHPYTLLAMVNMAILLSATGRPGEAEELILEGLPIADRNLGRDHIGTLYGRHTLGCILAMQERYAEAEDLLLHVTDTQKRMQSHRGDYHPDRLGALIELARCYFKQGKIQKSISTCDEAICGFDFICKTPHPLAGSLRIAREDMKKLIETLPLEDHKGSVEHDHHTREAVYFPFILFRTSHIK